MLIPTGANEVAPLSRYAGRPDNMAPSLESPVTEFPGTIIPSLSFRQQRHAAGIELRSDGHGPPRSLCYNAVVPTFRSIPRKLKSQAEILSAFASAFGQTLISHPKPSPESAAIAPGSTRVWAQNVSFHLAEGIVLKLKDFVADLQVKDPERPLIPEMKDSYFFVIRSGRIRLSAISLEAMINTYLLPSVGHPLKEARLTLSGDRLILRGKVHKMGFDLPITLESLVGITPEGMLELQVERIALSEVGLGGMFKFFKLELENLMELPPTGPLQVRGDCMIIDPGGIFPSPKAVGLPSSAMIERGELVLGYGMTDPSTIPPLLDPKAANYLLCVGHHLLIGKMMMHDAYLQIINHEPSSHLDFSLDRYRDQLAAGNSSLHHGDQLLVRLPNLYRSNSTGPLADERSQSDKT